MNEQILCTNDTASDCRTCSVLNELNCKRDVSKLFGFMSIALPTVLLSFFGLVCTGIVIHMWWPLIVFTNYYFVMIAVIEPMFLCSHCPLYAADGKILHCHANEGSFKLRKFTPGPMNRFEKLLMILFILSFVSPGVFLGYTAWYYTQSSQYTLIGSLGLWGIEGAYGISIISLLFQLSIFMCSRCVNFSCPLNRVPKRMVDQYLLRNPVMKNAWEESGYTIEYPITENENVQKKCEKVTSKQKEDI